MITWISYVRGWLKIASRKDLQVLELIAHYEERKLAVWVWRWRYIMRETCLNRCTDCQELSCKTQGHSFHNGDKAVNVLVREVRVHGLDAHRCILSKRNNQVHWLSLANKGVVDFEFLHDATYLPMMSLNKLFLVDLGVTDEHSNINRNSSKTPWNMCPFNVSFSTKKY